MDFIDPILSVATTIYSLCEEVKANKKRCQRVAQRVRALQELVMSVQQRGPGRTSADVDRALTELHVTLTSAEELIRKYTSANLIQRMLKSYSHGDDFGSVNERLNDAFQVLSGFLQVEQGDLLYQVFEMSSRQEEDRVDGREDEAELMKILPKWMKRMEEKADKTQKDVQDLKNMEKMVETIKKPSAISQAIREIRPQDLTYDFPKTPFFKTSTSEVYRGEYHRFTVAIKRYIDPLSTCPKAVRDIFLKEVETMRRFESPNILRMFGICVQNENGPNPQFLIIMEYCEKGSLRQVLDSSCELSWRKKARMSLDAAQGLYRLHQTEEKSKVHGCINSSKFLVAEGFIVKLGGLELAKTETSLRKKAAEKSRISSLCYSSPQQLSDINLVYSKQCEMYSFGIVLWEIATRKKPFEGCSGQQILQKVCQDRFQEPLPADCPESLGQLIDACRAFDCFQRLSAGVLVDNLRRVVQKLED
ncbi:mixed lineage kinase domain-like protein [Centroberyx gerrardi]|uniref:mixed lineage kinase domain-like protein n=1 Tax=Centroberyx gerrardi TaxID=166262 RepID=UPI003AABFCE1